MCVPTPSRMRHVLVFKSPTALVCFFPHACICCMHTAPKCTSSSSQGQNDSIQLPHQTIIRVQDQDWIPGQHCPKHRMTTVTLDHSGSPEAEWLTELLRTWVNKVWDFIVLLTTQRHLRTNIHKDDRSRPLLLVTSEKQHVKWSLGRLLTSPTCQTKN